MTPIRKQYLEIKKRHLDAIVLFRLGDFYETFDEDAKTTSETLDIVLTGRNMGHDVRVPMAGVPAHSLDTYLARLIKGGHKVAICEQLSDPSTSNGLVKRDVVRVVTPGTIVEPLLLEQKINNYIAAIVIDNDQSALAYADITTSEFACTQLSYENLLIELERLSPSEVLIPEDQNDLMKNHLNTLSIQDPSAFQQDVSEETIRKHFGAITLEGFGLTKWPLALRAVGGLLEYLSRTQMSFLKQLSYLHTYNTGNFMALDRQTRRNLELFHGGREGNSSTTLLQVLDFTQTGPGSRLLRKWVGQPLIMLDALLDRQDKVAILNESVSLRKQTRSALDRVSDLERITNRAHMGTLHPRELISLNLSLNISFEIKKIFELENDTITDLKEYTGWNQCAALIQLIDSAIEKDPRGEPGDGTVIVEGFSAELDELRSHSSKARGFIAGLEREEIKRTNIKSLKVGYNKVFGYYIEVRNPHLEHVPEEYIRKQTLVGAERFITPKLKEYESLILSARERIFDLEKSLYLQICNQIGKKSITLCKLANALAHIDVYTSLAEAAYRYNYVKPELNTNTTVNITGGRHPVVERMVPSGTFTPNDTNLSNEETQLIVLTGPNMSGKSTYLRQVALIVLMAQIGSFVPADSASIGLVDRIFTRIGIQDDLAKGESTFMVEMVETATILNQSTSKSLVILDEIGRGTSTYDGISIARAVVEYLHNDPRLGCKTLFATHYHELTAIAKQLPRVSNFSVSIVEQDGKIIFLHRIIPGGADKSYGVHVAQLAGLPRSVTSRAWQILSDLENTDKFDRIESYPDNKPTQIGLFGKESLLLKNIAKLDIPNMTPLEAMNKLYELQQKAKDEEI